MPVREVDLEYSAIIWIGGPSPSHTRRSFPVARLWEASLLIDMHSMGSELIREGIHSHHIWGGQW